MTNTIRNWSRNCEIYRSRKAGAAFAEIGAQFGITGGRARQIFEKMERMLRHHSRDGMTLEQFFAQYQDAQPKDPEAASLAKKIVRAEARLERYTLYRRDAEDWLKHRHKQENEAAEHLSALRVRLAAAQKRKEK